MKMRFIGAAGGSVTGSCTHFHYPRTGISFLVDCGLVQGELGSERVNAGPFPFEASEIQFVLLTHAHIDHCGLLPKLYSSGFSGDVICTAATAKLARLSLLDSAGYQNAPFSKEDVNKIRFKPIEDDPARAGQHMFPVTKDLFAGFRRTAHIVGACSVTLGWTDDQDRRRFVVMSGDLGNNTEANPYQSLLAHRRGIFAYPDAIVVESTYGDRPRSPEYKSFEARIGALRDLVHSEVFDKKALLLLPAFSLQRTQEVLLDLAIVMRRYFTEPSSSMAPYLPPNRFWANFSDDGWTKVAHDAITLAVAELPEEERASWEGCFVSTGDGAHPNRLAPGATKTLGDVRALVEKGRHAYPVDIVVDSKLAREMGGIIREELDRRRDHKPEEFAYRNPKLAGMLEVEDGGVLENLLDSLMPRPGAEPQKLEVGLHTVRYGSLGGLPTNRERLQRGLILVTGGGMCDGGPVVKHLEELATKKAETVLVQTGYMSKGSLGGQLVAIAKATEAGEALGIATVTVGSKVGVASEEVRLRTVNISHYYSGHADQDGLVDFVFATNGPPKDDTQPPAATVFINHGSPPARLALKTALAARAVEGRNGDRTISESIELPQSHLKAYDLQSGQWEVVETEQSVEKLLASLLREQRRTNELLQRLLQARADGKPALKPRKREAG